MTLSKTSTCTSDVTPSCITWAAGGGAVVTPEAVVQPSRRVAAVAGAVDAVTDAAAHVLALGAVRTAVSARALVA